MSSSENTIVIENDHKHSTTTTSVSFMIASFFALSILTLILFYYYILRRKRLLNRRYKMKERTLYFDSDIYKSKSNFTFPLPSWSNSKNDKLVQPIRGVDSGVPSIIISKITTCGGLGKDVLCEIDKLDSEFEQFAKQLEVSNSTIQKIFPNKPIKSEVYAIQHLIHSTIHENIYSVLGKNASTIQQHAAFLKQEKELAMARSVISLLDWEVYTHMKKYLSKPNNRILSTDNLISQQIQISIKLINNALSLRIDDEKLEKLLLESVKVFVLVKSVNPNYSFDFIKTGEVFNANWMEFVDGEEEGIVCGGLNVAVVGNGGCEKKSLVF